MLKIFKYFVLASLVIYGASHIFKKDIDKNQANALIASSIEKANQDLPRNIVPFAKQYKMEYSDHVLTSRFLLLVDPDTLPESQKKYFSEETFLNSICKGQDQRVPEEGKKALLMLSKALAAAEVTVKYIVKFNPSIGDSKTIEITIPPSKCHGFT